MKTSDAENLAIAFSGMLECKGIVGVKIAYNLRKINEELKEYYDYKENLFKKYGEVKDGVLMINKESPSFADYLKEIKPLEDQEVELKLRRFTEKELEGSELNAKQMSLIWELVDENNE